MPIGFCWHNFFWLRVSNHTRSLSTSASVCNGYSLQATYSKWEHTEEVAGVDGCFLTRHETNLTYMSGNLFDKAWSGYCYPSRLGVNGLYNVGSQQFVINRIILDGDACSLGNKCLITVFILWIDRLPVKCNSQALQLDWRIRKVTKQKMLKINSTLWVYCFQYIIHN